MTLTGHRIIRDPKKPLHYYQKDAVRDTEKSWKEDGWDKSLITIPTGGGKSLVTGELCAKEIENGGRCLFLAHTRDLVGQPKNSFEEDFGCLSTIEMAEQKADDSPMVFASVQTMANRIKSGLWRPDTFQKIVLDECHRTLAPSHLLVAKFFGEEGAKIVGCTATPRRGDKRDLFSFYDGMAYDKPIQELFAEGYLIEPTVVQEPLGIVVKQAKPSDVTDDEIAEAIDDYLEVAADRVMKYAKGRCGISFLPLRKTAMRFCELLRSRGLKCEYVAGKGGENGVETDDQKRIKRDLILGKIDHVCNAMLWSEGVDVRPANLLVDLRPTQVWTAAMQKWGRITRTYDPSAYYADKKAIWHLKTDAILMDFCFETERHSMLQRPAAIVAKDDEEVKAINRVLSNGCGGNLMEALKQVNHEREETLRKRLEAMRNRKARTINAIELFMNSGHMDLVDYEPMAKWELERPTQKQIEFLAKQKFDMDEAMTKGKASQLINVFMERFRNNLATGGQIKYCVGLGATEEEAWKMTFQQAGDYINKNKQ